MDFYNIFFVTGICLGLILTFFKPTILIGRIGLAVVFGISAIYGLLHPTDFVKITIDLLATILITWELLSKRYKAISTKQSGVSAIVVATCAIILGVLSPVLLATYFYIVAGLILFTEGFILLRQR